MKNLKKIDYITLYPSGLEDYNVCIMIAKNELDEKYLLYAPKVSKKITINMISQYFGINLINTNCQINFEVLILPDEKEKTLFKIFPLDEPNYKEMTLKEIETKLNTKVKIIS